MPTPDTPTTEPTPPSVQTPPPFGFYSSDSDEPLGLLLSERDCPKAFPGATAHRFELNSQGDRLTGRLLLPEERSGPSPLIVIQGDAGESCDTASLDFAGSWVRNGFALATIDLPLHGERSSPKFSKRLLNAIESVSGDKDRDPRLDARLDANGKALLLEFTRQSVCDFSRTLDGLGALPAIDERRIGIMGVGHGATLVTIFASHDSRARAVALAHCSEIGLPEIDPVQFVANIGPRPVLLLESARSAKELPNASDAALFGACAEPKTRNPSDDESGTVGCASAEAARAFFADPLANSR